MTDGTHEPQISSLMMEKNAIALCLPMQVTLDAAAAALALYHALNTAGKAVTISSSEPLNPEFALFGQEQVKNTMSAEGDVLIVSVPFKDNGVENVTYNVENDRVNIVIKPEEGALRFDPKNVEYTFSGGKADVVVTLYAPTLDSLGELYTQNIDQFQGVPIVNIDRHFTNSQYGTVNMVDKRSPSLSLMVMKLITDMKIELTKELATLLFTGLSSATNNFSSHSVDANTFKSAAFLLEKGAEKRNVRAQVPGLRPMPASGMGGFAPQGMPMGQPSPFAGFSNMPSMPTQTGQNDFMSQPMPTFEQPSLQQASFQQEAPEDSFEEDFKGAGGTVEFKESTVPKPAQPQHAQQNNQNGQQQRSHNQNRNQNQRHHNRGQHRQGQQNGQQNQQAQQNQQSQPQRPQENLPQAPKEMPAQDWLKPQIFNNPQGNSRV